MQHTPILAKTGGQSLNRKPLVAAFLLRLEGIASTFRTPATSGTYFPKYMHTWDFQSRNFIHNVLGQLLLSTAFK